MSAMTDPDLIARVIGGDVAGFEGLMRRHNQRLYRAARAILANDAEAEDVVQHAWVTAYQHLSAFRGEASFATWVTRIAVNEALRRRKKGARQCELSLVPDASLGAEEATPEEVAAGHELARHLEPLIDRLPDAYRVVFVLRDIEEMSTAEAAECLGISEESVRVRLHRARRQLQEALAEAIGAAAVQTFRFDGERCDRIVRNVTARITTA